MHEYIPIFNLTLLTIICTIFSVVWPKNKKNPWTTWLSSFSYFFFSIFSSDYRCLVQAPNSKRQSKPKVLAHSIYMLGYFGIPRPNTFSTFRIWEYGYFSSACHVPSSFCLFLPVCILKFHMNFRSINISCSYFRWLALATG